MDDFWDPMRLTPSLQMDHCWDPRAPRGRPLSSRAGLATFFFPDQKNRFFLLWGLLLLCKWTTAETLWGALLLWKWTSILAWKWTIQHIHSSYETGPYSSLSISPPLYANLYRNLSLEISLHESLYKAIYKSLYGNEILTWWSHVLMTSWPHDLMTSWPDDLMS